MAKSLCCLLIMPLFRIYNVTNMSFNAIRDKKILAKISEFISTCIIES